jgi:hypothetical protein
METELPRGGARVGAGRPKGSKKVVGPETKAIRDLLNGGKRYETARAWMLDYLNDPSGEVEIKARLAIALLPFQLPKLESIPAQGGKKEQLRAAAAEAVCQPKFAPPAAPRVIALRGDAG